jgi:thiamine-phosphate pyrophosphorylase
MNKSTCRLYLTTPGRIKLAAFSDVLETVLDQVDCASLLLNLDTDDQGLIEEAANELMAIAFPHDTAFLIADAPDLALKLGADGVHLSNGYETYADVRKTLGADRIVGVGGLTSRHEVMQVGEAGADYIAFNNPNGAIDDINALCQLTQWWTDLFEVPCVAFDNGQPDAAQKFIAAGTDFLCAEDSLWTAPQGPVKTAKAYVQLMQRGVAA